MVCSAGDHYMEKAMIDTNKARELAQRLNKRPLETRVTQSGAVKLSGDVPDAAALLIALADAHDAMAKDAARLDAMFKHCRIVYYGDTLDYPIEHAPRANKDSRMHILAAIDAAMGADNG